MSQHSSPFPQAALCAGFYLQYDLFAIQAAMVEKPTHPLQACGRTAPRALSPHHSALKHHAQIYVLDNMHIHCTLRIFHVPQLTDVQR